MLKESFWKITGFLIAVSLAFTACGSTDNPEKGTVVEAPVLPDSDEVTSENPTKLSGSVKDKTLNYKISDEVMFDIENGSSESLKRAASQLKKNSADYSDNEKILLSIAKNLMEIVWPSVPSDIPTVSVDNNNPYMGAINSAKNGIFDSSTGNVDFLSTILPAIVVLTSNPSEAVLQKCEKCILDAQKINSKSMLANYLGGVVYEKMGDSSNAERFYKLAYENSSSETELSVAYARVLSKNGNQELASKVLSSVSSTSVNDIQVLKQNAYIAYEKNDLQAAEEYVARVLQQNPNDLDFVLFRAKIFIGKNDYIHAVSLLDMYARQNDTNLDYLVLRASVQLDWSKNTTSATETVEKALRLYPDSEDALMIAAKLSSTTDAPVAGKYADELAQMVLDKNPKNTQALSYALEGLILRENWQNAYEISTRLINMPNVQGDSIYRHVNICIHLGKKTEAFEVANNAYNSNKKDEAIIQSYVYAYTQIYSRDASLSLINSFMDSSSSKMKSFLYYRRSYLQRTEDTQLADLRSSLIANPRNSDALFRLYEIYYEKKDYRKAQYYLKQVVAIKPNDSSIKKLNDTLTQLIK